MIWSRCHHRPIHWVEIVLLAVILFLVMLVVRGCDSARADWVVIDKFGGVNTDVNISEIPMGQARYAVGVYTRDGALWNGNYLHGVRMSYVSMEPCRILGSLAHNNGILFDNGFLQWYDATGDSSYIMQDTVVVGSDTARGIEFTGLADTLGDLLVMKQTDTLLAKFALSDLAGIQITPVGGALKYAPIRAIYSEKYIRLRDTGLVVNGTKYFIKIAGSVIGARNLASLSYVDTTLFFNGEQMTIMTNAKVGLGQPYVTVSPPGPTLIRYIKADRVDTNQCGMLRFKGHAPQFFKPDVGKFLYPQDTSCVYRGAMFMIVRVDSVAGQDSVNYCVLADTVSRNRLLSMYGGAPIRIQVFSRPTLTQVQQRAGVVPRQMFSSIDGYHTNDSCVLYNPLCSAQYIYSQTWNTSAAVLGPWGDSVRANEHALENDFWEFRETPDWEGKNGWSSRVIFRRTAGDTTTWTPYLWPHVSAPGIRLTATYDSLHASIPTLGIGHMGNPNGVAVYRAVSRFPVSQNDTSGVSVSTSHYTIAELHRGRAFYAGNQLTTPWDSTVTWAYSNLNGYRDIAGRDRFEGGAAIVGISSMGSNLVWYRQRPPNAIISMSGVSNTDFYFTPLASGVGAVSDQSIARNPLDEADYFPNNLGMWRCDGGSVTKVETNCEAIFRDSINWGAETQIVGAVFDNHYWLAAPFGASTINNRFLAIDLKSGAVTFVPNYSKWIPGSMGVLRIPGYQDRLYAGAADTGKMFQIRPPGTNADGPNAGEWRSGWFDFGDPARRKAIRDYVITYQAREWYAGIFTDSIIVDFYRDFSDTPSWSDRFGYYNADFATQTRRMPVPPVVEGRYLSFGIRFSGDAAGVAGDVQVTHVGLNVTPLGIGKPR